MKLFVYIPYQSHTFGSMLIAANSQEEAVKVIEQDYSLTREPVEFSEELQGVTAVGQPRILHFTVGCL